MALKKQSQTTLLGFLPSTKARSPAKQSISPRCLVGAKPANGCWAKARSACLPDWLKVLQSVNYGGDGHRETVVKSTGTDVQASASRSLSCHSGSTAARDGTASLSLAHEFLGRSTTRDSSGRASQLPRCLPKVGLHPRLSSSVVGPLAERHSPALASTNKVRARRNSILLLHTCWP